MRFKLCVPSLVKRSTNAVRNPKNKFLRRLSRPSLYPVSGQILDTAHARDSKARPKKKGSLMSKFIPSAMLIAQVDIAIGSGRLLPTVAAVVGLIGVVVGGLALARSRRAGNGRAGAIVAAVLGLISLVIGGLHTANSAGGFGTGNGLAGAIVAILLGLVGIVLGGLALARSRQLSGFTSGGIGFQSWTANKNKTKENSKTMSKVSIRYMIDDVPAAVKFYTMPRLRTELDASPAFARQP